MFKTRAGESVTLVDLLDEAVERAARRRRREEPGARPGDARSASRAMVGIGAVKYADLSSDRVKGYVFDYAPHARVRGQHRALPAVRARAHPLHLPQGGREAPRSPTAIRIVAPAERALALCSSGFRRPWSASRTRSSRTSSARTCSSSRRRSPRSTRRAPCSRPARTRNARSRLALADLTARVLARGLDLLGIDAPERM